MVRILIPRIPTRGAPRWLARCKAGIAAGTISPQFLLPTGTRCRKFTRMGWSELVHECGLKSGQRERMRQSASLTATLVFLYYISLTLSLSHPTRSATCHLLLQAFNCPVAPTTLGGSISQPFLLVTYLLTHRVAEIPLRHTGRLLPSIHI